jgi:hypothetical protein
VFGVPHVDSLGDKAEKLPMRPLLRGHCHVRRPVRQPAQLVRAQVGVLAEAVCEVT